jgi:hypothetical protein
MTPKSRKPIANLKAGTSVTSPQAAHVKGGIKSNIPLTLGDDAGNMKAPKSGTSLPPPPPK